MCDVVYYSPRTVFTMAVPRGCNAQRGPYSHHSLGGRTLSNLALAPPSLQGCRWRTLLNLPTICLVLYALLYWCSGKNMFLESFRNLLFSIHIHVQLFGVGYISVSLILCYIHIKKKKIYTYGDAEESQDSKENAVFICNHQSTSK